MSIANPLILGEFSRKLDERFRLTLPAEFEEAFKPESGKCVIAKEQLGCLSLWDAEQWKAEHDARVDLIVQRLKLGDLNQKKVELQKFGRLLSTRHREIQLAGRARVLLPEGFREFLAVEPGQETMVVGAINHVEIWNPKNWFQWVGDNITEFGVLLDTLSH